MMKWFKRKWKNAIEALSYGASAEEMIKQHLAFPPGTLVHSTRPLAYMSKVSSTFFDDPGDAWVRSLGRIYHPGGGKCSYDIPTDAALIYLGCTVRKHWGPERDSWHVDHWVFCDLGVVSISEMAIEMLAEVTAHASHAK